MEQAINELYEKADQLFSYHVGDEIKVNGIDFYVISDSPATQDYVVALKKDILTYDEVSSYAVQGQSVTNQNGKGYISYYSSDDCSSTDTTGCLLGYDTSNIKIIIDNWYRDIFNNDELKEIDRNKARIITYDEYLGISSYEWKSYVNTYYFAYSLSNVYYVDARNYGSKIFNMNNRVYRAFAIRPVINVYKSAIQK